MPDFLECRNGKVWPNDRPGLGVSIDERQLTFIEAMTEAAPGARQRRLDGSLTQSPTGTVRPWAALPNRSAIAQFSFRVAGIDPCAGDPGARAIRVHNRSAGPRRRCALLFFQH